MKSFKQILNEINDNTPILSRELAYRLAQYHMKQMNAAEDEPSMRAHEQLASEYHTIKRRHELKQISPTAANDTTDLNAIRTAHDESMEALTSSKTSSKEKVFHRAKVNALRPHLGLNPLPETV